MSTRDGREPDSEALLRRAVEIVTTAKSMPLSASVLVGRDEMLELLEEARTRLPEDVRRARWIQREREEYLAKAHREADEIVEAARLRAERMVQRTEVVRQARHEAARLVEDARDEARRLRHEAEDYCDQRLANFEIVLERLSRTVEAGRAKLQGGIPPDREEAAALTSDGAGSGEQEAFFDQDR